MKQLIKKNLLIFIVTITIIFSRHTSLFSAYLNEESTFNNIVVFIRFADESNYEAPYDLTHYEDMFNGINNASLYDYYDEASYGSLAINSFLISDNQSIIFYEDVYDRSYFSPYDATTNPNGYLEEELDIREHNLLKRTLNYVDVNNLVPDDLVLDYNVDGEIDSITFLISGEDNGWDSMLWPHKWQLHTFVENNEYTLDAPVINGVHAYKYTVGLLGNSVNYNVQTNVGTLAHETFHLLSAPDLYHYYRYGNVAPVGNWGLMEYNGEIPSHMLGYMKYKYGNWMNDATELTSSGTYTLTPLQDTPGNYFKINTGDSNEWIYLEYRDEDGLYESNLPDTGLIGYRVDYDYLNDGNVYGYYDAEGLPANEVFVFRPGIDDITSPYTFLDNGDYSNDGDEDLAAISQYNPYSSMGYQTDIPIFLSSGEELYIRVYNVIEDNGFLTFDVYIPPQITLDTQGAQYYDLSDIVLYDHPDASYRVEIDYYDNQYDTFYTLDGSTPTRNSLEYTGGDIAINADHNTVKIVTYDGTEIISRDEKTYHFETSINSAHSPYNANMSKTWYLDFGQTKNITFTLNALSETEQDYDYLMFYTDYYSDTEFYSFTGDFGSSNLTIDFEKSHAFVTFYSDGAVSEFYGFDVTVDVENIASLELVGEASIDHSIYTEYTDEGVLIVGSDDPSLSVETVSTLDINTLGTYTVTYRLKDGSNTIIDTIKRTINVLDLDPPAMTLNGDETVYVELGDDFIDKGVTAFDNYDTILDIIVGGDTVDTTTLGTYIITYDTTDSSDNTATQLTRTVIVEDTIAPTFNLDDQTIEAGTNDIDWATLITQIQDNSELTTLELTEIEDTVDYATPGVYMVMVRLTDTSGNFTEQQATITVEDTTPPSFTISNQTIEAGEFTTVDWLDYITSAYDNSDVDLVGYILDDTVNYNVPGTYNVELMVEDASNNQTTKTFNVTVEDTTPPEVSLNEVLTTIPVGSNFEDTGLTIDELTETTIDITGEVDNTTVGSYTLTYTVTDTSGNKAEIKRVVHVYDSNPTIEFNLNKTLTTLQVGETFEDTGCTVTINEDTQDCIVQESTVDTEVSGIYKVTYSVAYNGKTYTYERYVFVYDLDDQDGIIYYKKEEKEGVFA